MKRQSVIQEIFNGQRGCIDTMDLPEEYKSYNQEFDLIDKELKPLLDAKLQELYRKALDAHSNELTKQVDFYFVEGFKLGFAVCCECLDD